MVNRFVDLIDFSRENLATDIELETFISFIESDNPEAEFLMF